MLCTKLGCAPKLTNIAWEVVAVAVGDQPSEMQVQWPDNVDVLIGGISATAERVKHATFSEPYLT